MKTEFLLWLPIILLALASIVKMLARSERSTRNPWSRIEEIKENE